MPTYIIAEAGVNHNGSIENALRLVDCAAAAGADAIKFQTFRADLMVTETAPMAEYQILTTASRESQREMLKRLELNPEDHELLVRYCTERGIAFLSSPFDATSVDLLANQLDLPRLKVASGEITNAPLLLQIARTGKGIILSTGMCTLKDIEIALGVLAFGYTRPDEPPSLAVFEKAYSSEEGRRALAEEVVLLHCTSEYPAPFSDVNLRAMDVLRNAFGLPVGLSDHTRGIAVAIAAAARGASVIEKHLTLDRSLPGPDHQASLEPGEFGLLVESIRQVEEALGSPWKTPSRNELQNRAAVRKSLVAKKPIRRGERFTPDNLTCKRPGHGVSPVHYWDWLGRHADRSYAADDVIMP